MKISFDFDGVITDHDYVAGYYPATDAPREGLEYVLRTLVAQGHSLYVCSARIAPYNSTIRRSLEEWDVLKFFKEAGPNKGYNIFYDVKDKAAWCNERGIHLHVDDHPAVVRQFFDPRNKTTACVHFNPERNSLLYPRVFVAASLMNVLKIVQELTRNLTINPIGPKQAWDAFTSLEVSG